MKAVVVGVILVLALGGGTYWYVNRSCDDLPAESGGCDRRLTEYEGETCDAVAEEWGRKVDEATLRAIDEDRNPSADMWDYRFVASFSAGTRLAELGLAGECDADRFLEVGTGEFSDHLKEEAGRYMYDNADVPYETWLAETIEYVNLIFDRAVILAEGGA